MLREMMNRSGDSEDLAHGQVAIIAARWVLVISGLLLAMWNAEAMGELRVQLVLILGLAVANFFLHAQVLMRRPVLAPVVYVASAADIAVISLIVIAGGGLFSNAYVFYFPAILVMSVAFRTPVTFAFAGSAIALYRLISMADVVGIEGADLATRMIMLAGVAVCGNVYWRVERDRRLAMARSGERLNTRVREEIAVG